MYHHIACDKMKFEFFLSKFYDFYLFFITLFLWLIYNVMHDRSWETQRICLFLIVGQEWVFHH